MYTRYSPEGRLLEFLRTENTSTKFIADLAKQRGITGLSRARLNQVERGLALRSPEVESNLAELMRRLEHLRDSLKPIPISFRNEGLINELLRKVEDKTLLVVATDVSDLEQKE